MPVFIINTNISRDKVTETFINELTVLLANLTAKPEMYVSIQVNSDQTIAFGGSSLPCALCTVNCIGALNNGEVTKNLMEKINKDLGIPSDRLKMPAFVINTNVSRERVSENFITELSALVAKSTGKPESYVAVQVNPDQIMAFGGSTAPCAICTVFNLGRLKNGEFTKHVMDNINKDLEIPTERMYIFFSNFEGGNIGFNGSTF